MDRLPRPSPAAASALALLGILAAFLLCASRSLDLPAPWHDEVLDATYGMELALGLRSSVSPFVVHAFGRSLPMQVDHPYDLTGFAIYASALSFAVGGVSVRTLRWTALSLCAGLLLLLYALARIWFSRGVALSACLLLAADPAFFIWGRLGFFAIEWFAVLFASAAALFGSLWLRRRRTWMLCAGAFFLGFGLNVALKAMAFVVAFPLVWAALARRARPTVWTAAAAALSFCAGAINPIAYNLASGLPTLAYLWQSLLAPTVARVDNAAVLHNLGLRLRQLSLVLSGAEPAGAVDGVAANWLAPAAFAASAACLAWLCLGHAKRRPSKPARAVLLVQVLLFTLTAFTPAGLNAHHLLVLWPYPELTLALAAAWLGARSFRGARALAVAAVAAVVLSNARVDAAYLSALRARGGDGLWSDSLYQLADYLDSRATPRPLCLTWGVSRGVYFLTRGRIKPFDAHRHRAGLSPELTQLYDRVARDPATLILAVDDAIEPNIGRRLGYYAAFRQAARRAGRKLVLERRFCDRQGRPVFLVYRLARA